MTTNVLILCTHNSARSVLGEGMLNHLATTPEMRVDITSATVPPPSSARTGRAAPATEPRT